MTPDPAALAPGVGQEDFSEEGRRAFLALRAATLEKGALELDVHFASLPRRVGREQPWSGILEAGSGRVDAAHLRTCDAAAALLLRDLLLHGEEADLLRKLYFQGDAEERRMVLKSLAFLPGSPVTAALLEESHRTNDENIFQAGLLDSDLPMRVLDKEAYNCVVLKVAFLDIEAERVLGIFDRANEVLSRILLDFRAERQAAGRTVWAPTLELAARAPCAGVLAEIAGDLWHGSDQRRLAAARAAQALDDERVSALAAERRELETKPEIREILDRLVAKGR